MGNTLNTLYASSLLRQSRRQTKLLKQVAQPDTWQIAPGWYYAQGDPSGSVRYWDGQQWTSAFKP